MIQCILLYQGLYYGAMIGLSCRSVLFYYRILVVHHQLEGLGLQARDMKYVCTQHTNFTVFILAAACLESGTEETSVSQNHFNFRLVRSTVL